MSELSETNVRRKQQGTRVSPFGWVMIAFLFALGVINFADKAVLGLAAIPIIKELHLSAIQYGLVSGSLFWLFSLSSVLVTAWADVVGTKKVLALLATTWALVQFATLFVISFPALLLTRVVLGAGEGPSYGTSVTAAAPWLPPDRRAFGLGVMTFGSSIGPAVFVPLLTFMIVAIGWRSAFVFLGGIGALWVVIWLVVARERLADRSTPVHETHGAHRRTRWSRVLPVAALLILGAMFLYLAVSIPSTLGAVTFFILAATAGAAIPLLAAIVLDVTPQVNRGSVQGVVVAFSTLPGFIAPLVTGVMIQATGNQAAVGLHNAYLLAALLLLAGGVGAMAFVRPDKAMQKLSAFDQAS